MPDRQAVSKGYDKVPLFETPARFFFLLREPSSSKHTPRSPVSRPPSPVPRPFHQQSEGTHSSSDTIIHPVSHFLGRDFLLCFSVSINFARLLTYSDRPFSLLHCHHHYHQNPHSHLFTINTRRPLRSPPSL